MVKNFTYLIATGNSTCDTVKQQAEVKTHYFQLTLGCFFAITCQKKGIPEIILLLLQHRYLSEPKHLPAWPDKHRGWWLLIPCCWLGREMGDACLLVRPLCRGCCDLITKMCRWMGGFPRQPQCIQKITQPDFILPSLCWCKVTFAELSSSPSNIFFTSFPLFPLNLGKMHSWCNLLFLHWQSYRCADLHYLTFAVQWAHTVSTFKSF